MKFSAVQNQNFPLYLAVALSSVLLFMIALGPGFTSSKINTFSWHYQVFEMLCHQDPDRSYYLSGNAMAVCSRCIGIYSFFVLGWLLIPVLAVKKIISKKIEKWLFTSAILVNFIDVLGNHFELWTNTLNTRFLLGTFLGLATALFLTTGFYKQHKSED